MAESLETSGIITGVISGIGHNIKSEHLKLTATRVQLISSTILDTLIAMLNSIIFILLGISLPEILLSLRKLWILAIGREVRPENDGLNETLKNANTQ